MFQGHKRYWYIHFHTNAGPGASYAATEGHPLHPEHFKKWATQTVHQASLATKIIIHPESLVIDFLYELPEEVAKAVFPKDFTEASLVPAP